MKKTQSKKTKKQKRVLATSILLAALIVGGGTFAWLTSKDQVTNKLSASSTYGVTITESFTPPSQWVPGEKVTKEVAVVNTGNIDAFVKLKVVNSIDVTAVSGSDNAFTEANKANYIVLSTDERISLQAGGNLIKAPDEVTTGAIDSANFTPTVTGLYIFQREELKSNASTTVSYAGYYFVNGTDGGSGVYYKVVPTTKGDSATYPKTSTVSGATPTLDYTHATTTEDSPYITATYKGAKTGESETADDIVININLDKTELAKWTFNSTDDEKAFYYNYVLKAGATTGNLITSVTLDKDVESDAYISFDYYLTVDLDSAQVTSGTGTEIATAVNEQGWGLSVTAIGEETNTKATIVTWGTASSNSSSDSGSSTGGEAATTEKTSVQTGDLTGQNSDDNSGNKPS
jgi:predicted ribosomally synthesized peptide with SipW-like signal peptide